MFRTSTALLFLSLCFSGEALVHPALVHTGVGFLAGSAGCIAAYPMDFVKSQLQTEEGRNKYKGGWECALDIVKSSPNGPLALYRGVIVNVIGIAPEKTIKLSVNTFLRNSLMGHFGYLPLMGEVFAGGIAGATQVIVTNPLEVTKLKVQTSQMSIYDALSELKSLSDFYQGAGACMVRDVVFSAILFPLYAHLKVLLAAVLMDIAPGDSTTFWADFLAGSLSAGPAALLATPADVVKTRLQQAREHHSEEIGLIDRISGASASASQAPKVELVSSNQLAMNGAADTSFLGIMSTMAINEGPDVLFSGWFERVIRSVPQFGVTLAMFDLLNTFAVQHGWLLEQSAS